MLVTVWLGFSDTLPVTAANKEDRENRIEGDYKVWFHIKY